jgi:hypothetical protein
MAKEYGLGVTTLSIDDSGGTPRTIKNDITNFQFATPRGVQDVTGIDKFAYERLLLLADFSGSVNMVYNDAAGQMFDVFKTVASSSATRTTTLVISGQTFTNEVIFTDCAFTRAADGAFTASAPFVLADGTIPVWS